MSDIQLPPTTRLAVIREIFAGLLALTVMILFLTLMLRALGKVTGAEFGPIKDLLAIVNPTVGLIIGYYFSRVTSEARAENAEANAAAAGRTAIESSKGKAEADAAAQQSHQQAAQAKLALSELVQATEHATAAGPAGDLEGLAPRAEGVVASAAQVKLAVALERAKRVLG